MFLRSFVFFFLFIGSLNAAYEEIRIGKIDNYYANKLSYEQLRKIIDEIEFAFENRLNENIFDYSENGKPIDILYVPASKLEQRIEKNIQRLQRKEQKLQTLQEYFPSKQKEINSLQEVYKVENLKLNKKVEKLNAYIKKVNKEGVKTKKEYAEVKEYIKTEKSKIKAETRKFRSLENKLRRAITRFNNKVHSYNNSVNEINRLANQIESMSRNNKKVKGMAFGLKQTVLKTSYKDGKKTTTKSVKTTMSKIEIYGFESLEQLKAVIAHEIGHLVGIPHISAKGALMNPVLQENQVEKLELTIDDIENFLENF